MKPVVALAAALSLTAAAAAFAAPEKPAPAKSPSEAAAPASVFTPRTVKSTGTVSVEGRKIDYDAMAGRIIVHAKGWDDATKPKGGNDAIGTADGPAVASMFYVAYFKHGVDPRTRPITFLYNGGPGSATIWLHMGAFGPVRVVTRNDSHTPAAPYGRVDNSYSLLDASDLVFIDAPGAGFSRIAGKDKEKAFWGVDQDAYAFASFIKQFLSQYDRWNSPKYLFGESYGTPRSAVVVNELETNDSIDFNGVILLSQILNFDLSADLPDSNPGVELPYEVALPTYAATAWYHHKLASQPADLDSFLKEVEQFAMGDYANALEQGASLPEDQFNAIAGKLHDYTGLPVAYIKKANLRISGPKFEQQLQIDADLTTGRLDTRFSGPTMDPLGEDADYDPQSAAIGSAYVSVFNDYARRSLHYTTDQEYRPAVNVFPAWEFKHQPPDAPMALPITVNVMPDLATAMKYNPNLKVCLNGGYFDLATPFYEGMYEMQHLDIPQKLQSNIEYHYYESGHMVYANETSLKQIHDNVAAFIRKTDNQAGK
jgi:carboxypeptidase C (cathepsin A)